MRATTNWAPKPCRFEERAVDQHGAGVPDGTYAYSENAVSREPVNRCVRRAGGRTPCVPGSHRLHGPSRPGLHPSETNTLALEVYGEDDFNIVTCEVYCVLV